MPPMLDSDTFTTQSFDFLDLHTELLHRIFQIGL